MAGSGWAGAATPKARTTGSSRRAAFDDGEDLEAAARRELHEETGIGSVALLGRTEGWLAYDFPAGWSGSKAQRGWKGQKQVWFAYRFTGADEEVNLGLHQPPEFDAWRWATLAEAPRR